MPAFVRYLNALGSRKYTFDNSDLGNPDDLGDGRYWQSFVNVAAPEHIDQFAQKFGLSGTHLKSWNNLGSNFVYAGTKLKIWHPVYVLKHTPGSRLDAFGALGCGVLLALAALVDAPGQADRAVVGRVECRVACGHAALAAGGVAIDAGAGAVGRFDRL